MFDRLKKLCVRDAKKQPITFPTSTTKIKCIMIAIQETDALVTLADKLIPNSTLSTIGIGILKKNLNLDQQAYEISLSPLAGTARMIQGGRLPESYFKDSDVILLCPKDVETDLANFDAAIADLSTSLRNKKIILVADSCDKFDAIIDYLNSNPSMLPDCQVLLYVPELDAEKAFDAIVKQTKCPIKITKDDLIAAKKTTDNQLDDAFASIGFPKVMQTMVLDYADLPMTLPALTYLRQVKLQLDKDTTPAAGPLTKKYSK